MNIYQSMENSWVPYIGHCWSLAVEEHFYLFWPILIYIVPNKKLSQLCLSMIAFSFAFRIWTAYIGEPNMVRYIFTFSRFDALSLGAYMAVNVRISASKEASLEWLKKFTVIAASSGLFMILTLNHFEKPLEL